MGILCFFFCFSVLLFYCFTGKDRAGQTILRISRVAERGPWKVRPLLNFFSNSQFFF